MKVEIIKEDEFKKVIGLIEEDYRNGDALGDFDYSPQTYLRSKTKD